MFGDGFVLMQPNMAREEGTSEVLEKGKRGRPPSNPIVIDNFYLWQQAVGLQQQTNYSVETRGINL